MDTYPIEININIQHVEDLRMCCSLLRVCLCLVRTTMTTSSYPSCVNGGMGALELRDMTTSKNKGLPQRETALIIFNLLLLLTRQS